METLKILIFNWRCWLNPDFGGAEILTYETAIRWVKAGHEVTLFTAEFPDCKREEVVDGIRVVRAGGKYLVYRMAKKYYKKRFSKEGFDVIIDEINTIPFLTPKFVNKGEKIIASIHQLAREYWFYETSFPVNYIGSYYLEDRWLKNYLDIPTVTLSESTKQDLFNLGFKKVFSIPPGVNFKPLNRVSEKEKHPVIAYVGRLKRQKRADHAIKAFKLLKKKIPTTELWIIGDGYFKKNLQALACDGVRFFHNLSNEERRQLLIRAWVLVHPGIREGFGLNIIEANALSVPAVAYDVPGLRDAIQDGKTGLLIKSGGIQALADVLYDVLISTDLREKLSENALESSRNYTWERYSEAFMKIITQLIRN
jgi:glycosyltransferase involved in cell wall biosynthesis|tara:strand:- start:15616 stop:16716 length:1101 start_codon:yes stop_codon:yes gene_type:complete